jgi:phenylalanyl-tRNA synthetase beta chain
MKLGLFTDAVTRLSKGMDPNLCKPVVVKAAEMMKELSGGKIASDIEDDYRMKTKEGKLTVDPEKIRTDLGVEVENAEIKDILQRLGLGVKGGKIFELTIPTFRADLKIPEDINEEVARIYGYDKVEPTLPVRKITPVSDDKYRSSIVKTKKLLSSFGANEMYTYSFVSKDLYKNSGLTVDGCYKLVNAISPELVYMRPLIFPSLLEKVPGNYKNFGDFCSFEVDIVDPCKKKNRGLPEERWHLGVAHTQSFYHLKLYLEHMLKGLNVSDFELIPLGGLGGYKVSSWIKYAGGGFHPLRSGLIRVGKDIVGIIGEIDVAVRGKLDLPSGMSVFELDMDYLSCYIKDTPDYILVSKYPTIVRDYSFVTAKTVLYKEIYDSIRSVKSDLIRDIDCLDIYSKKESDEKKTTFRITYQSNSKTLESEDIDEVEKNIISNLKKKVHGRLAE